MTAGRWANPTMPARYTRNQAAADNAVAQYYQTRPAKQTSPVTTEIAGSSGS